MAESVLVKINEVKEISYIMVVAYHVNSLEYLLIYQTGNFTSGNSDPNVHLKYKLNLPIIRLGSKVKSSQENLERICIKKFRGRERMESNAQGSLLQILQCKWAMILPLLWPVARTGCVRSLNCIGLLTYWWFARGPDNGHHYVNICHLNSHYVHLLSLAATAIIRKSQLVFRKYWMMNFEVAESKKSIVKKTSFKMHL